MARRSGLLKWCSEGVEEYNKALVKVMHMRAAGEAFDEEMATQAGLSIMGLGNMWNHTIPVLRQKIITAKQAGSYNRTDLIYETCVGGEAIKLVEMELLHEQDIPYFTQKIERLEELVLEYCESNKPCNFIQAKQYFQFAAYDSSFEHYLREEGMARKKCKQTLSIDQEIVDIYFRQLSYCLWIGKEHCNSQQINPGSYFLSEPFPDLEHLDKVLKQMAPKLYTPKSHGLRKSQIQELTSLIRCLYDGEIDKIIDDIVSCESEVLMRDLIDGTACDSGTKDLRTLEACVGQTAAAELCGEAGELSVCLNI